jgi:hypothetical protein
MKSDDKDLPLSPDFKKSQEAGGPQIPDVLTSKTGALLGLAAVLVIAGVIYAVGHIHFSKPATNPLESRAGFAALKSHVESLAEVDRLCAEPSERVTCLCELADRVRDERRAIESALAADPALKDFKIEIRPSSYTLATLPKAPDEADCLNAVSAPTILDEAQ